MTPDRPIFTHRLSASGSDSPRADAGEIFPYWSFTKTVIAICALRMVQDGRLDLDAPLAGFDFSLRHLLDHTAGLPDYFTLPAYGAAVAQNEEPWSAEALRAATLAQGRLFAPGTGWSYSNLGYMVARDLLEEVAGRSFSDLLQQLICAPLELSSITLAQTRRDFESLHWAAAKRYHPGWVYHGCLKGTAADAARLLQGLFEGALLDAEMLREMRKSHPLGGTIEGRPWTECGYALGLMSGRAGEAGRMIGHSGAGPFSVNAVYHFPDLSPPVTVASFTDGTLEGVAEHAAVATALSA